MRRWLAVAVLGVVAIATLAPGLATACRKTAPSEHGCCCKPARAEVVCAPDCCDAARSPKPQPLPTRLSARELIVTTWLELPVGVASEAEAWRAVRPSSPPFAKAHAPPVPLRI